MRVPFYGDQVSTTDDAAVATWLNSLFAAADTARKPAECDWIANILYLTGQQWEDVQEDRLLRSRKVKAFAPNTKAKVTVNHIYPLVRQAVSAIRQNMAKQVAVAATSDPADLQAAELATDFLRFRWDEDGEEELRTAELVQAMAFGRVLRRTTWDSNKASLLPTGRVERAGDIDTMTLNPFRFWQEPGRDTWDDTGWIIEADIRSVDEVKDMFGVEVLPENVDDSGLMDKLTGWLTGKSIDTAPKKQAACHLRRLYMRPTLDQPKGKYFVWAGSTLLEKGNLPDGHFPYVPLDWFWVPGRSYPMAMITPIRDVQRHVNIRYSQLEEVVNRQLRGDLVVQGDGDIRQETLANGSKIIRVPMQTPKWEFMQYNMNTSDSNVMLDRYWNEEMKISGIHEPAQGGQVAKAVTATELAMSKESDMTGLSMFRANFDMRYCEIDAQKLLLARDNYDMPRMLRSVGEANSVSAQSFFGSDLRNTEDVRPRTAPILTQAMQAEMRSRAAEQGLFGPYASAGDKLAKLTSLLNTGIPGIEDEVDQLLGQIKIEDLRKLVAEIDMLATELQVKTMQAQLMQFQAPQEMGGAAGVDQFGNEVPMEQPMQEQLLR